MLALGLPMAAASNLRQPSFPKISCFSPTSCSSSRFILPAILTRRKCHALSTSGMVTSMAASLGHLPATRPVDSVAAIVNPALANANVLFFSSGYNIQIIVDDKEPEESIVRRFRRAVNKAGIIRECRRRRFFENKQDKEKRKKSEIGFMIRRRRLAAKAKLRAYREGIRASNKKKVEDDSEENWEYFEADFPLLK